MDTICTFFYLCCALSLLAMFYPDRWVLTSSRPDIPGPRGVPLFGNLFQFYPWRAKAVQWICHILPQYNDIATVTMPPWGRCIVIGRPEWLAHIKSLDMIKYHRGQHEVEVFTEFPGRRVPVTCEGPEWRLYRRVMGPIFTPKSISEHVHPAVIKVMTTTVDLLTSVAKEGRVFDWNDLSSRISLSVLCFSSLSLDTGTLQDDPDCLKHSDKFRDALVTLNGLSSRRMMNPFWRWTEKLTGADKRFQASRNYMYGVVEDIVTSRRKEISISGADATSDFVSQLLATTEDEDPLIIRDILVTVLFAGRDNTHNSLNWSMHALLTHPEWLMRMREEADRLRYSVQKGLSYAQLGEYHIHQAVFYEVVRLWPGIPKNARLASEDDVLPFLSEANLPEVHVRKGDYILWSDYYMMRHSSIWGPDAAVFNPGRHLDSKGQFVRPKGPNFNAFGMGPRLCPAVPLVTYEFIAIWSTLLSRFDFTAMYKEAPTMIEAFTPVLGGPLSVAVNIRS